MSDSRRFREFARVISQNIPLDANIADVAGGKGYLQSALRQLGYQRVTSWDKRKKYAANRRGYHYGLFNFKDMHEYDAVVAMHPDDGTDHAVIYAGKHRVPAIICPCCVKPSAVPYQDYNSGYGGWLKHLHHLAEEQGMKVTWIKIDIDGRNDVMILFPNLLDKGFKRDYSEIA